MEQIVESTARLITRYGVRKTNVADVARDTSMSSANIYRFFASKDALQDAVVKRIADQYLDSIKFAASSQKSALTFLKTMLLEENRIISELLESNRNTCELIDKAIADNSPAIQHYMLQMDRMIASAIQRGAESGEFSVSDVCVSARTLRCCLISLANPQSVARYSTLFSGATADQLINFALQALVKSHDTNATIADLRPCFVEPP